MTADTATVDRHDEAAVTSRTIVPRRELPRARALVGGFLVMLAAVAVFVAYRRAEAPPTTSYVVVTSAIAPGERLEADDLAAVPIDLPEAQARTAYTGTGPLVGAVATGALSADQLVTRTDVRQSAGYTAAEEMAFSVPASNALGGSLSPGERVDVIAAYGQGADAYTLTVARDALLIARQDGDSFAGSGEMVVRLGLDDPDAALALAHAVTQAEIFLVRSPDGDPADGPYRPLAGRAETGAATGLTADPPSDAGTQNAGQPGTTGGRD